MISAEDTSTRNQKPIRSGLIHAQREPRHRELLLTMGERELVSIVASSVLSPYIIPRKLSFDKKFIKFIKTTTRIRCEDVSEVIQQIIMPSKYYVRTQNYVPVQTGPLFSIETGDTICHNCKNEIEDKHVDKSVDNSNHGRKYNIIAGRL